MLQDKEQEIRLQFLAEAEAYLATIESGLLGLGVERCIELPRLDGMLRAAHSLKGGAGMMGYSALSHFSHRLEDVFKILKARKNALTSEGESLLIAGIDGLRQVIRRHRQGNPVEELWLNTEINPPFEGLHQLLGEAQPEDNLTLLSEETEENFTVLLFQTEVEAILERLETVIQSEEQTCLREEFLIVAQELGGLGEMLELPAFSSLCVSVQKHLEKAETEAIPPLAKTALEYWRRSQALVLVGQEAALPSQLEVGYFREIVPAIAFKEIPSELPQPRRSAATLPDLTELAEIPPELPQPSRSPDTLLDSPEFAEEALSFLSELEISPLEVGTVIEAEKPGFVPAFSSPSTQLEFTTTNSEQEDQTIRVATRQLEQLSDLFGELTIERNGLGLQLASLQDLAKLLAKRVKVLEYSNLTLRDAYDQNNKRLIPQQETGISSRAPSLAISPTLGINSTYFQPYFDGLEMDNYSHLHPLFQELMETIVQIQEVSEDLQLNLDSTQNTARDLTRTSQLLQNQLTQVRMRPLSDITGFFPRTLRDLSLKHGKPVELKINGGATLLDRSVLETLSDPLLHILRNAFAHGIESPDTRSAKGKPPQGLIELSATYRGNQTVITIRDDGAGIDLEKIRARALKYGFSADDIAQARESELIDLIFEPGFTTAEVINDLSGRGVGMDIVRTNLQQVRGKIHVETKANEGTTFTITVPFTLSVVRVLLVESGGMLLALPTNSVEAMLIPSAEKISNQNGQEMLDWKEKNIPLIRLHQWLQFNRSSPHSHLDATPIINQPTVFIIAQGSTAIGVEVDRYWGEQEVTTRTIEGSLKLPPGLTGCTILGDGRIVPFIDAPALLHWIEEKRANVSIFNPLTLGKLKPQSTAQLQQKSTVMVVDDSINVRRYLALTLEKAGYRVQQAKDGQDALEKLQDGASIVGMICDIEMPRLDGYGVLAQVKSNPIYQQIPVIMLTSRSGEKHRQLALNLGANAYFSKPFQEQELLQTLKGFIHSQNEVKLIRANGVTNNN